MIRINFILMVLICCLSLSACADSTKQSVNDGKKVTEATPEPTMDPISAEENVINSFYDTMYEVRNDLKKYTYSTVAEETEKLKEPFNELKKQKKIQTGKYKKYFTTITSSNSFQYINDEFLKGKKNFDKNRYKQKSYAIILQNCLEVLLKEKMPIENANNNEIITELRRHHSDGRNLKGSMKIMKAFKSTGLKSYIFDFDSSRFMYIYPNAGGWFYLNDKTDGFVPMIKIYKADDNITFSVIHCLDGWKKDPHLLFVSGKEKVKVTGVHDFDFIVKLYESRRSAKKNKTYDRFKKLFDTGKKVKLKVGDKVIQTYGKREIKDMKKYFVMTDILIELYS